MSLRIKFLEFGCDIPSDNIEACHRVGRHDNDLPEETQIFVNQSLCPYYKSLWSKSKKLRSLGKIPSFFISNNTIETKLQENSNPDSIIHSSDFQKFFPDVDLVPSNL